MTGIKEGTAKKYQTLIREGVPTVNGRIYSDGSLETIKGLLQPYIEKNICFAVLGADADAFCKYNGYNYKDLHSDKAMGLYSGIVKSFDIVNGQGELEIAPLKTSAGHILEEMQEFGIDFKVDFLAYAMLNNQYVKEINEVVPVILLRRETNESKD